ncbi:MAG: hypothetical protein HQM08_04405 [Candidatus Riflebacteria bacterium]|nr:hypothetical protein [Candidatus Riflebacteria bacterium]
MTKIKRDNYHPELLRRCAFSLLEVLIAVSIFAGAALLLILTMRQGAGKTEVFSNEHFTAMFLAQKVLEDINDRVVINPHFFNELIASASGADLKVVDGESPFFRLLENTKNFETLDAKDDLPITPLSKDLYDQLKGFKCRVESFFISDPENSGQSINNLIEVRITISWKDASGNFQKYKIQQMIHGQNRDTLRTPIPQPPKFPQTVAVKALCSWFDPNFSVDGNSIDSFIKFNKGGDPNKVLALGRLLSALLMCNSSVSDFETAIQNAKTELQHLKDTNGRPDQIAKLTEYLAQLKEQKASTLFYIFGRVEEDLRELAKEPLNTANIGEELKKIKGALAGAPILLANHLFKISLNFAIAEANYKELLIPMQKGVSANREIFLLQHFIDLRKAGILISAQWGMNPDSRIQEHQANLISFLKVYKGHQPIFCDYLSKERQISKSINTLKYEYKALDDQLGKTINLGLVLDKIKKNIENIK